MMAIISGTLRNASGVRANTAIMLVATKTTSRVITKAQDMSIVTDANGAYSFECNPSCYLVVVREQGAQRESVGSICVYPDSLNNQSLEQYLTDWNPDENNPEIIDRLEALEASARASAESAKISAENATVGAEKLASLSANIVNMQGVIVKLHPLY